MLRASSRLSMARKFGFPAISLSAASDSRLVECSDAFYNSVIENLKDNDNPMTRTKYNKAFLKHMYDQANNEQLPIMLKSELTSARYVQANSETELRRRNVIYSEIVDGMISMSRRARRSCRGQTRTSCFSECQLAEELR